MNYLYKINSSYDGFTPQKIEERLVKDAYLIYNWREYFDTINKGDIIFTYFVGTGVKKGVYLISKISEIKKDKRVVGKVLRYNQKEPLILPEEFKKYEEQILVRPIASVYVIPPSLNITFDNIKKKVTISEIEIVAGVNCYKCFKNNLFNCGSCPIFNPDYLIKWDNEVFLNITNIEKIISPFWIIPRQQHWIKKSTTQHIISRMFYSFKDGYKYYSRVFAFGILKALANNPHIKKVQFNYIIGIPLSPDKKNAGEFDRVAEICEIISHEIGVEYIKNGLLLSQSISKGHYRWLEKMGCFFSDYYNRLQVKVPELNNKTVLLIDDVVTDGTTLRAASKKIKELYPTSHIYAATGGIMAKKGNMKTEVINKFSK